MSSREIKGKDQLRAPNGDIVLYTAPDGQTRLECRFENESIWLTQALIAELYKRMSALSMST